MTRVVTIFLLLPVIALNACKSGARPEESAQKQSEVSPYAQADAKRTAFFEAVQRADVPRIENLIAQGFDVNTSKEGGVTPLIVAAGMNADVRKTLMAKGASVNAKTAGGYTALMSAALKGQKEIVKLLLDGGADPSAKDTSNRTAMKYAVEKNHKEIVDLLKQAGAKE